MLLYSHSSPANSTAAAALAVAFGGGGRGNCDVIYEHLLYFYQ